MFLLWFKRLWPAIPFLALSAAAYFQARGAIALVRPSLAAHADADAPRLPRPIRPPARLDADPILARNPFDSQTGPLGRHAPVPPPSATASAAALNDPLDAPKCEFGWVTLIAADSDPAWSFAAIEKKEGRETVLRRVGGTVAQHTVQYVSWNRVWLTHGSGLCQLKLGDKPRPVSKKKRRSRKRPKKPRRRSSRRLPKSIASKIHKVSATEYTVERSALDEIMESQLQLLRSTRVRPVQQNGRTTGMRMSRVRKGTLLHAIGLRSGDVVQSVNGFELTDPQRALEAYGRLRTADHLGVSLTRKGKPVTVDINIR